MKATINRGANEEVEVMLSNTQYWAERAKVSEQRKEEDLKMRKEHQTLEREKIEVLRKQQMQMRQQ